LVDPADRLSAPIVGDEDREPAGDVSRTSSSRYARLTTLAQMCHTGRNSLP